MAFPAAAFQVRSAHVRTGTYVVAVAGELADVNVPELVLELERVLLDESARTVIVDVVDVTSLDAEGVAAIARAAHDLRSRGGRVVVASSSIPTRRIFELTGLTAELELASSLKEALEVAA
jgi:anti-anti-sigma factor